MSYLTVKGGLERVLDRYPELDLANTRLVGWGAGQVFDLFFPITRPKLEYAICPWPANQGRTIHGIPIRPPSALLEEDPERTLVLLYVGDWSEIMRQVGQWGPFKTIRAISRVDTEAVVNPLRGFKRATVPPPRATAHVPSYGVVMQGPLYPGVTKSALMWNRIQHPNSYLVVSTWNDERDELLEEARALADAVVTSELPRNCGFLNRNAQIRSTKAGLSKVVGRGLDWVVKTRTDHVLTGGRDSHVFDCAGPVLRQDGGARHRIGVHLGCSWMYVPFHFTDQLIAGRTDDIENLWDCPEDSRIPSDFEIHESEPYTELCRAAPECYVYGQYAQSIEHPTNDLVDSFRFARDYLYPLDPFLEQFSLKGLAMFDVVGEYPEERARNAHNHGVSADVGWWMTLQTNFEMAERLARHIQSQSFTVRDFFSRRIGPVRQLDELASEQKGMSQA